MKETLQKRYDDLEETFNILLGEYNYLREEKERLQKQNLQLEEICLASGIKIPYKDESEIPF